MNAGLFISILEATADRLAGEGDAVGARVCTAIAAEARDRYTRDNLARELPADHGLPS
jgi:hypothetical protein